MGCVNLVGVMIVGSWFWSVGGVLCMDYEF